MGCKLKKCKACHRPYVVDTGEPSSECPHCKESENLALLTDPKWLRLDDKERRLYSDLNTLNDKIDDAASRVKPKEKETEKKKEPWTLKSILALAIVALPVIALFVYGFISDPNRWKTLGITGLTAIPIVVVFVPANLIMKHKDKKYLMELEQEREKLYEKIADTQIKKASYREEWLAEKRKQSHSLTEDESKDA